MENKLNFVCVVNNYDVFRKTIENNSFMNKYPINVFDNTKENIGISKRYNGFIENIMKDDMWLIFCHQDFGFLEDPLNRLLKLDPNYIYGSIGAIRKKKRKIIINLIYSVSILSRFKIRFGISKQRLLMGQIDQFTGKNFIKHGMYIREPEIVDTVDCSCLIIHSSLIKKYDLRFDENLDFHQYAEEFCLNAKYNHHIDTKAVQFKCQHMSYGSINRTFYDAAEYIKSKYRGYEFVGTCPFYY